jgi:hypothetical protein
MPRARLAEPEAGPECYRLGRALSAASATDPLVEGAAAVVLGFSFLGFFASRFPRCSPFGIALHSRQSASVALLQQNVNADARTNARMKARYRPNS